MTRSQLEAAANDFILVMDLKDGPEGHKKPLELTVEMEDKDFLDIIKKAIPWIEPSDVFQPETLDVIAIIKGEKKDENKVKPKKLKVDPKDEEVDIKKDDIPSAPSLMEEITATENFKELKLIAQAEPEFKSIRGRLASFKDIDSLREEMVWLLSGAKPNKAVQQELPIEKTQAEIAAEGHKKNIEDAPLNSLKNKKLPKASTEEAIVIPEDSYPEGELYIQITALKTRPPFSSLFAIDDATHSAIVADMCDRGYDKAFPIIVWNDTVIDGHTRLAAAFTVGLTQVPIMQKEFADEKEALDYAIHNQRDRRNLSEAEILHCIEAVDAPVSKKVAGAKGGKAEKGSGSNIHIASKTHKETAKKLKVGETKVLDARVVLADAEAKAAVESGKKSISKAAKDVRAKKANVKPKKEKAEEHTNDKTMIDACVEVLRTWKGVEKTIEFLTEEADITFEGWAGIADMDAAEKDMSITLVVCQALGLLKMEGSKVSIGKKI